ncbi:lipopolysaccharide transport system permease protein [Methylohalomonas lacus]|uniref:Transport permease protein n=1 Tax=Methylohalomonas lacus TaxID=398773 RepID=A0AAE3HLY7_9GAMM|nr:ABC transporter permease [Methylohalomonas lacus]MCS3903571.1 lipopolysaccharide transport system permease protein [Methylohalomonas lacus]
MLGLLCGAWAYRYFILSSIRNDLTLRFARSKLGGVWMIIHPLVMVAIYAFILSAVLQAKLPGIDNRYAYAIYLTAGIMAWTLFTDIVTRCLTLFIEHGNLMKKMVFPKVTLPLIVLGSCLVNNFFLFLAVLGIFATLGHYPGWEILWLPLLMGVTALFGLGIGLLMGAMNVFMRDIGQVVPVVLQVGFWLTPIVYPLNIVPEQFTEWLSLNPMFPVVSAYQAVFAYQTSPELGGLVTIGGVGALLLLAGLFVVRRASAEMADVL